MWFQIELPGVASITEIHFNAPPIRKGWGADAPAPIQTYPRGYILEVSADGSVWREVASGQPENQEVQIVFEPTNAKYIRITQTGTPDASPDEIPWSMRQMKIYGYSADKAALK
jgi:hypothetical protein